jgi:hypothetical protein
MHLGINKGKLPHNFCIPVRPSPYPSLAMLHTACGNAVHTRASNEVISEPCCSALDVVTWQSAHQEGILVTGRTGRHHRQCNRTERQHAAQAGTTANAPAPKDTYLHRLLAPGGPGPERQVQRSVHPGGRTRCHYPVPARLLLPFLRRNLHACHLCPTLATD